MVENADQFGHSELVRTVLRVMRGTERAAAPRIAHSEPRKCAVLPSLRNAIDLEKHIDRVAGVLEESNLLEGDEYAEGYAYRTASQFVETLKDVPEVHAMAVENIGLVNWKEMKRILLSTFCTNVALSREMDRQLELIQCHPPYGVFLHECRKLHFLSTSTNRKRGGQLTAAIIDKLPEDIQEVMVQQLTEINPIDWENAVPYYAAEGVSFLSLLGTVFNTLEIVNNVKSRKSTVRDSDYFNKIAEQKNNKRFEGSPWLKTWTELFKRVLVLRGQNFLDDVLKLKETHKDNVESKIFSKSRNGPYALVGLKKDIAELPPSYKHDFKLREHEGDRKGSKN